MNVIPETEKERLEDPIEPFFLRTRLKVRNTILPMRREQSSVGGKSVGLNQFMDPKGVWTSTTALAQFYSSKVKIIN